MECSTKEDCATAGPDSTVYVAAAAVTGTGGLCSPLSRLVREDTKVVFFFCFFLLSSSLYLSLSFSLVSLSLEQSVELIGDLNASLHKRLLLSLTHTLSPPLYSVFLFFTSFSNTLVPNAQLMLLSRPTYLLKRCTSNNQTYLSTVSKQD